MWQFEVILSASRFFCYETVKFDAFKIDREMKFLKSEAASEVYEWKNESRIGIESALNHFMIQKFQTPLTWINKYAVNNSSRCGKMCN